MKHLKCCISTLTKHTHIIVTMNKHHTRGGCETIKFRVAKILHVIKKVICVCKITSQLLTMSEFKGKPTNNMSEQEKLSRILRLLTAGLWLL